MNEVTGTVLLKFLVVKNRPNGSPPTLKRQTSLPNMRSEMTASNISLPPSTNKALLFKSGHILQGGSLAPLSSSVHSHSTGRIENYRQPIPPLHFKQVYLTPRPIQSYSYA